MDGKLEIATFTDEKVNQPLVQAALSKVKVIVDESIPEPGPYCPVTVEMKNGARFSHTARVAKGDPRNPMTDEEVMQKFRSNAKLVLSEEQAGKLAEVVRGLEAVGNVRQVTSLLTPL
jgi:2-methylcitrate dehydratase